MIRATPKSVRLGQLSRRDRALWDEDVRGLHIAVHDPPAVGVGQRAGQRDPDLHDVAVGQAPGLKQPPEGGPAHQLRDEVRALVVDRRFVQGHDPRMAESRGGPRLALEATADNPLGRKHLDRDVALQSLVAGVPDCPEPARSKAAVQAIPVQDDRAPSASRRADSAVLDPYGRACRLVRFARGATLLAVPRGVK